MGPRKSTDQGLVLQCLPALHAACRQGSNHDVLAALGRLRSVAAASDSSSEEPSIRPSEAGLLTQALQVADANGITPLMHAVQRRQADVVSELLAAGAHPSLPRLTPSLNSPLHVAALKGDLASVRHLVSVVAAAPAPPPPPAEAAGVTAAAAAATTAATAAAAAVDLSSANGSTPLLYACGGGHLGVAAVLLKAGADPGRANDDGVTPLMAAASGGHPHVLQLLLRAWRESGRVGGRRAATAAEAAAETVAGVAGPDGGGGEGRAAPVTGDTKAARSMSPLGTAVAAKDINGSTALHYAARGGCSSCLAALLEAVAPASLAAAASVHAAAAAAAVAAATDSAAATSELAGVTRKAAEGGMESAEETAPAEVEAPLAGELLRNRNRGGRDVLAEARLSGDAATIQLVEIWLRGPRSDWPPQVHPPTTARSARLQSASNSTKPSLKLLPTKEPKTNNSRSKTSPPSLKPAAAAAPAQPGPRITTGFEPGAERSLVHGFGTVDVGCSGGSRKAVAASGGQPVMSAESSAAGSEDMVAPGGSDGGRDSGSSSGGGGGGGGGGEGGHSAQSFDAPKAGDLRPAGAAATGPQEEQQQRPHSQQQPHHRGGRQQEEHQEEDTCGQWRTIASRRTKPATVAAVGALSPSGAAAPAPAARSAATAAVARTSSASSATVTGSSCSCSCSCSSNSSSNSNDSSKSNGCSPSICISSSMNSGPPSQVNVGRPPPPPPAAAAAAATTAPEEAIEQQHHQQQQQQLQLQQHHQQQQQQQHHQQQQKHQHHQQQQQQEAMAYPKDAETTAGEAVGSPGTAAAAWEAEALTLMQTMLPAALTDLELLPQHMCGLGVEELSAAQLEGLEALHRAALAKIADARLTLAVGVEVARAEEERRRMLEIAAIRG